MGFGKRGKRKKLETGKRMAAETLGQREGEYSEHTEVWKRGTTKTLDWGKRDTMRQRNPGRRR